MMADKKDGKTKVKKVAKIVKIFLKKETEVVKKAISKATSKTKKLQKKEILEDSPANLTKNNPPIVQNDISTPKPKSIVAKKHPDRSKSKPSKQYLPKTKGDGPKYFFHTEIPSVYHETYINAIPRDPQWLYVYWEISDKTIKELQNKIGVQAFLSAKRVLRLVDISDIAYDGCNADRYRDIEITSFADNWYIQVPESDRVYLVEYGFLTGEGKFFVGIRSNSIAIPRKGVSMIQDEEWTTVSTEELIKASTQALKKRMLGSSEKMAELSYGKQRINNLAHASGSGL